MSIHNKIERQKGAYRTSINSPVLQEWIDFLTADNGLLDMLDNDEPPSDTSEFMHFVVKKIEDEYKDRFPITFGTNPMHVYVSCLEPSLYEFYHFIKELEKIDRRDYSALKLENMFGIAEAMVVCGAFYRRRRKFYIHFKELLGHGTFNNAYKIELHEFSRRGHIIEEACLRVAKWYPWYDKGKSEYKTLYDQLKRNSEIFLQADHWNYAAQHSLPLIYLSSIGGKKVEDLNMPIDHDYVNQEGIVSWYILPIYETFEEEKIINIYKYGLEKYIDAILGLLQLVDENNAIIIDWKVENMGYGPSMADDGSNSFVLLDFDFQDLDTREPILTHNILGIKWKSVEYLKEDSSHDITHLLNDEMDHYIALKEVYALIYAKDTGGEDATDIRREYVNVRGTAYAEDVLLAQCKNALEKHKTESLKVPLSALIRICESHFQPIKPPPSKKK